MPKRKERTLKELYDVTEKIMEPEITPVLRGSCRIQGPVDETDRDIQKNTVSYRGGKRFGGHCVSERICKRAESGTCNVCSAPCSSCMHPNRVVSHMELKAEDEFSDETSRGKATSRCSFNVADLQPPFKNRAWGDRQCAVSESSNVVSASSSHESFCENAESKATLRTIHTSEASEDVEMLPKVLSSGTTTEDQSPSKRESVSAPSSCLVGADVVKRTFSNRFEDQKNLECHDDNISCVSGANDANNPVADLNVVVDGRNISSSSASVSSLLPKGFQEDVNIQSVPGCVVDIKCEVEETGKFRRPSLLTKEFPQNGNPTITSATAGCLTKSGLHEYPSPKDFCAGNGPQEVPSPLSHSESGKSPCYISDAKNLEGNPSPHHLDDPSECFTKHPESPPLKLDTPSVGAEILAMRSCNDILPKLENSKVSLMSSSSGPSVKIYPCVDNEVDTDSGDSPAESMKCLDHIDKEEKSIASLEVPDAEEPPLHSQPVDDSDDSDIVEDVKVCDICGDAGREDLLAICSRCGDGAEHTYCMRIMVDKVPEGDWLCEECKLKEEAETPKQEKLIVGASKVSCMDEKLNCESILSSKLLSKIPVVDAKRATPKVGSHSQFSTKRQLDSLDSVPAAKRQALDTGSGSPKPSSPGQKAALVRESSFKNLDKGRVRAAHFSGGPSTTTTTTQNNPHSPSTSGLNSSRNPPRQPRGTLLKSSSFSFSKPKVQQIKDEFLKKPTLARDTAAPETKKEGLIRRVDKSLSFHSGSRLNSTVKNKPQSFNFGNEDPRGKKLANERNFIERKNSFKKDRSVVSSPKAGSGGATPKAEQKAPRSESLPVSHPATNYRDIKDVQPNGRLSKPASILANRGLDIPKSLAVGGDLRRQSSCLSRGIPSPLSAMTRLADHKPTQLSPKDEPMTSSLRPSDRPCSSPDAVLQDGLHQSQECISQSRQITSAGDNSTRCHKCKETGHAAPFCPLGTSHISVLDASAVRSSKEGPNKISKLKGAVEAVILRKTEAHKNIIMPGQSNELTMSSTGLNCEVAKDHSSTSSCLRSLTSVEVIRDGQDGFRSSSTDSSRSRTTTNVNILHPFEAVCTPTAGDSDCLIFSNGNKLKPILTDSLSTASTVVGPLSISSIPEYDYIWQGGFEVRRSGRPMELYDGIQAHLSTCASPKVLEAMNKVPCNLLLEEVPRLSTWPSQFHTGATEDNIALYFFAKDFESYERNYKSLVDNLIKNDLALKVNLDGVELLIFSSNQLPEKSQRWNMLFFLWGVFRGRKVNCSEQAYASETKLCGADLNELPSPAMTVSQRDCSSGDAKDLSTIFRSLNEQKAIKTTITVDLSYSSLSGKMDKYDGANLHSSDNPLGSVLGTNSSSRISTTDELHAEMKGNDNSMDEQKDIGSKTVELETRFGVIGQNNGLDNGNKVQVNLDNLNSIEASLPSTSSDWKERSPGSFKVLPVGTSSLTEEVGSVGRRVEENFRERSNGDAVILLEKIKEEEAMIGAKTYLDGDLVKKEFDGLGFKSSRKRPCAASGETFTGTSQSMPWTAKVDYIVVDEESEYKRMKSGYSEMRGSSSSSSRDQSSLSGRFPLQMHSHSSIFPIKEQRLDGSYDDMGVSEDSLTTERRFFPMDLGPVKDWRVGGNTIPLHVVSSDDEDQPESEFPNLELALGGEKKPSKQQGMLPLFAALDKKHDQEKEMLPDINVEVENREEDALASLSLSLAFPFSEKERNIKSVSQPEAPLPERQPVDTSLILFGGFSDT